MNNLENWVLSLNQKDYINIITYLKCDNCPAFALCNQRPEGKCADIVREWAFKEAEQDEERNL